MNCTFTIDGLPYSIDVDGRFSWGNEEVLFDDDCPLSGVPWVDRGFVNLPVLGQKQIEEVREGTERIVLRMFRELGIACSAHGFRLEDYHRYVRDSAAHDRVIAKTRNLSLADFPGDLGQVYERIQDETGARFGETNPELGREVLILRISRPRSLDINPPHRDGYLKIWRKTVNVWLPVAGCSTESSLAVLPGSHLWNEKDIYRSEPGEASIEGRTYRVPAIMRTRHGLHMVRPNPRLGEALVFTPFLIHGAAINAAADTTRMSYELRPYVILQPDLAPARPGRDRSA